MANSDRVRSATGYVLMAAVLAVVCSGCSRRSIREPAPDADLGPMAWRVGGVEPAVDGGLGATAWRVDGAEAAADLQVGAGVGYVLDDEADREHAVELDQASQSADHAEVGPLGGTKWILDSVDPADAFPPYVMKVVAFGEHGHLITSTTLADGKMNVTKENYRVVDDVLIVNKPGYIINARFSIENGKLTLSTDSFRGVLRALWTRPSGGQTVGEHPIDTACRAATMRAGRGA